MNRVIARTEVPSVICQIYHSGVNTEDRWPLAKNNFLDTESRMCEYKAGVVVSHSGNEALIRMLVDHDE